MNFMCFVKSTVSKNNTQGVSAFEMTFVSLLSNLTTSTLDHNNKKYYYALTFDFLTIFIDQLLYIYTTLSFVC